MNNKKTNAIIKFTLREYFESKFFVFFNIISLVGMLIGFNFNSLKQVLNIPEKETKYKIEVIDSSNILYDRFVDTFKYSGDYEIVRASQNNYTKDNIKEENIIIEIFEKEKGHFKSTITTKQSLDGKIKQSLNSVFINIQNEMFESDYNLKDEDIKLILDGPEIETVFLSVVSEGYFEKIMIKYLVGAVTMFIAMIFFSKIGSDIATEKQSKSSEYVLTTVSSKEYLYAKVFGNILFIIIQFLLMLVYLFVGIGLASILNISSLNIDNINIDTSSQIMSIDNIELLGALLVYNVLTLIILSFVQGALSAKSTSIQDASNSTLLLITTYTILFVSTMGIIDQYTTPNAFLYIVSVLPVVSSFFIPAMMIIGQCSIWQIVISLVLLIISLPISFNYSQKKFKEGILNYSKQKKTTETDTTNEIITRQTFARVGNIIGISIIIFLGSNVLFSVLSQTFVSSIFANILSKTDILLITQIIVSSLSIWFTYKYIMSNTEHEKEKKKHNPLAFKALLIALGLIAILQVVLEFVFTVFNLNYDVTKIFEISPLSPTYTKILFVLAIAIVPAIFEELLCRKALITLLRPQGRVFALLVSSLIFGLIHMNIQQFIFAFFVGLILALIYDYTKDIKYTFVIHFINNFISTLPILFGSKVENCISYAYGFFIIIGIIAFLELIIRKEQFKYIVKCCLSLLKEFNSRKKPSYIFLFKGFMFDISIISLLLLSIYQQNILVLLQ